MRRLQCQAPCTFRIARTAGNSGALLEGNAPVYWLTLHSGSTALSSLQASATVVELTGENGVAQHLPAVSGKRSELSPLRRTLVSCLRTVDAAVAGPRQ